MKIQRLIMLLCTVLVANACKKDTPQPQPIVTPELTLIYPKLQEISPVVPTVFRWRTTEDTVRISILDSLQQVVIDTTVLGDSLSLNLYRWNLPPNTQYTWRAQAHSLSDESSFSTANIVAAYLGTHTVSALRYCWAIAPFKPCDTTYTTTITLSMSGKKILATEKTSSMNTLNPFFNYSPNGDEIKYFRSKQIATQSSISFNMITDSIYVSFEYGGLGGGTRWFFKGKL